MKIFLLFSIIYSDVVYLCLTNSQFSRTQSGLVDLNIQAQGGLVIAAGKETSEKDGSKSTSNLLKKESAKNYHYDETTVASELDASGNVNLSAGDNAAISDMFGGAFGGEDSVYIINGRICLCPLFARAIGPFRWMATSGEESDIAKIDELLLEMFPDNQIVTNWIRLAREYIPFEGLPARVNEMVASGELKGPVAFRAIISMRVRWRIQTS